MAQKIDNYWFIGQTSTNEHVWKFAARGPRGGLPSGVQYVLDEDVPAAIRPDTNGVADVWITLDQIDASLIRTTT